MHSDLLIACGLVVLTAVLNLAWVVPFARHPLGIMPWGDEGAYFERAREIAGGSFLPDAPFYQDPLFPYALGGLVRMTGLDLFTIRVALAMICALTPGLIFAAGRIGASRPVGLAAGLLASFHGPLAAASGLLDKEGLSALLAALALLLAALALRPGARPRWAGLSGVAWGLVALTRANALALAPVVLLLGLSRRDLRGRAIDFAVGFALAIAPVTVFNAVTSQPHALILTTWQAGPNFYIGNGPYATGTYAAPPFVRANAAFEANDFTRAAEGRGRRQLGPAEVSSYWLKKGLERWRTHPGSSLSLLARKVGLVLHDGEVPDNQDPAVIRAVAAPALGLRVVSFGVAAILAGAGALRAWRSDIGRFVLLATALGYATTALFFVVGRYRVPWSPGLLLLAGFGVVELGSMLTSRRVVSAWPLALAVVAACLAFRPVAEPAPDRLSHAFIQLGVGQLLASDLDAGLATLDAAASLGVRESARVAEIVGKGPIRILIDNLLKAAFPPATPADEARRQRYRSDGPGTPIQGRTTAIPEGPAADADRAAFLLFVPGDPDARLEAIRLARSIAACPTSPDHPEALLLAALLLQDRSLVPPDPTSPAPGLADRLRLARAALRSH